LSVPSIHTGAGLAEGSGIKLDRLLHGSLYNKKEEQQEGTVVPQDQLVQRLLAKLQLHHRLLRPSEQVRSACI
jgi:hypothetical protein